MFSWLYSKPKSHCVAIVGAGMAGLAAARKLRAAGIETEIFEAAADVGGRLLTRQTDWALIDHGAQYFTARTPEFQSRVLRLVEEQVVTHWQFPPYSFDDGMLRPSPDGEQRYVGTAGMQSIAVALARGSRIHYNTPVIGIERDGHRHRPQVKGDSSFAWFDGILLALPPDQCRQVLPDSSDLQERLSEILYQPTWSVALGFEANTIPSALSEIGGIFVKMPELTWITHNSSKPERRRHDYLDTWVLHFSPEWSESNRNISPRQLQVIASGLLTRVLQRPLPTPVAYDVLFWPHARLRTQSTASTPPDRLMQLDHQAVFCCGDWAEGGRVEGAFLSGGKGADALIRHLRG